MINTNKLKDEDKVFVLLASDEAEEIEGKAMCIFRNGLFINIEDNHHKGEIYGSSVVKYKKISASQ